jgi:ABC-type transport system involved in cytochrome bd biosynthesis fused ATPase/permease subunit
MLRFLLGILLVQAVSVLLVVGVASPALDWHGWLPILVALATIGLVAAFWFTTVASGLRRDEIHRLREDFARQREDLRVKAEREKTRLVRRSHKDASSEARRTESRANRKVAMAVAAASAVGVLMIFASSLALGLSLLTGAGGALGGYLAGRRWPPNALGLSETALPRKTRRRLPRPSGKPVED